MSDAPSHKPLAWTGISSENLGFSRPRWRVWAVIALLSIFWHLAWFSVRPAWRGIQTPPPVEIQSIDPKKLDAIRQKWKEKPLLLHSDASIPKADHAPNQARYSSDRNIRVEKEQRAKKTAVIPKPMTAPPQAQPQTPPQTPNDKKAPKLGDLGVPIRPKPPQTSTPPRPNEPTGDQALLDNKLPEGNQNILNTQESVYYSFYSRLYEAIGPIWQSRINEVPQHRKVLPGEYITIAEIVLNSAGELVAVNIKQGSGIAEFDAAVESSWRKIARFPNPPRGLLNGSNEVHTGWTFAVRVGDRQFLEYLPPERAY